MLVGKSRGQLLIAPESDWAKAEMMLSCGCVCGESKFQRHKEQYCIGTWTVRSMNQDKLEVVKQEMARVKVRILGVSELKWTGLTKFNSDDYNIHH